MATNSYRCAKGDDMNYEQIARKAGFVQLEDGTIVPANQDQEGFWEDWQSCCEANGLGLGE